MAGARRGAGLDGSSPDGSGDDDAATRRAIRARLSALRRRRLEGRRTRAAIAFNMTPMIDVVFQLLVYFLVATSFALREETYRVDLPRRTAPAAATASVEPAAEARRGDPFKLDREPIRVLITTTGPNPSDVRLEVVGVAEEPASFEALRSLLLARRVDPTTRTGMYLANHPVVLEPSPATSWEHAVEAFNAAVRAGYVNVIFQTLD
ncbi:MAG: biopolymer transporter ExbD [Phycisphaerales bacterium]